MRSYSFQSFNSSCYWGWRNLQSWYCRINGGISPKKVLLPLTTFVSRKRGEQKMCGERMNILTFYISIALNIILCASTGLHEYVEFPRRRSRYRFDNRCSQSSAVQRAEPWSWKIIHSSSRIASSFPFLSARSLKITKVDCRQESGLNNWISNTYLPLQSNRGKKRKRKKGRKRKRETASQLIPGGLTKPHRAITRYDSKRRARASYGDLLSNGRRKFAEFTAREDSESAENVSPPTSVTAREL